MSPYEEEEEEISSEFFQNEDESFGEDEEMKSSSKISSSVVIRRVGKKTKVIWTKDLHNKFLEAVGKLGIDNAFPKKIVELMKVEGLTRDHVASHLQKYRILSKKIAQANYYDHLQNASKSSTLLSENSSSMINGASYSNTSSLYNGLMHQHFDVNPLILDTSSSYFPVLEASSFNSTNDQGYPMQAKPKDLNKQRDIIDDSSTSLGVMVSSGSTPGFMQQNLDHDYFYDYGGYPTDQVQIYDHNFEMGSSNVVQNSSNSSFVQNDPNNGFESDYSSNNNNLASTVVLGEDDLMLSEVDIAYLLTFANDTTNLSFNLDHTNQDVINGQNFSNNASFYSNYWNHNEERLASINQYDQTLDDGYLPGLDPTLIKVMDDRFIEPSHLES